VLRSLLPRTVVQVAGGLAAGCAFGWLVLGLTPFLPIAVPEAPLLHLGVPVASLLIGTVLASLRPIFSALGIQPAEALREE
jgi:ABC-type antimicrobial peptide transport system permease subunit